MIVSESVELFLKPVLTNERTVQHLRPVESKSKVELRLDVNLPDQPRRKSRSKSSGSIDTADVGGDICTAQEAASNNLTCINYITVTFSYAEGAYLYFFLTLEEEFWLTS